MTEAAFSPEQEARIRSIAIEVAVAAARVQAARECGEIIDRRRILAAEVAGFLDGTDEGPSA